MSEPIKKSLLSFPVIFQKIEDESVSDNDVRFTKVKIWLMHLGENFNGSVFEKKVVDEALPTLQYIPIVGFLEENSLGEKDFSDHRYVLVKDEKGVRKKYAGQAYGVITSLEDNNAHYEERLCDDGETRTFLVVEGLIWNMFEDSSEIVNRDTIKSQSMELWDNGNPDDYDGYEDENGLFHFTKFSFRASLILGKDYESGMIDSTVEVQFSLKDFVEKMQSELNDKYTAYSKLVNSKQGGKQTMPKTDFAQTVLEQFNDICSLVTKQEVMVDRWGDAVPRFYAVDVQDNEVIVVDRKNDYHYYGFPLTIEGDKPVIDFANGSRKKIRYENYEEGTTSDLEGAFDFGKHLSESEDTAFSKVKDAEEKRDEAVTDYENLKAEYDEIKPRYDEYVKAEKEAEETAIENQKDTIFKKFDAHLSDVTEYSKIKEDRDNMTPEDIEGKCSVLFAKKTLSANTSTNYSKGNSGANSGIVNIQDDDGDEDNFVSTRYGNIPINKR